MFLRFRKKTQSILISLKPLLQSEFQCLLMVMKLHLNMEDREAQILYSVLISTEVLKEIQCDAERTSHIISWVFIHKMGKKICKTS